VAWADAVDVICCGWPESIARATDCDLIKAATDQEYLALSREVAHSCPEQMRGRRCQAQLDAVSITRSGAA
jgi:hypothetical protein